MGSFPNAIWGSEGDQYQVSSTKKGMFGAKMKFVDGREFVYSRAGGTTALTAATLQQTAVVIAGHDIDLLVYADAAIGDTAVTIQNDGTSVFTINQYAEGFMFVNDATGNGYNYKIKANAAGGASDTVLITLEEGSALRVALVTTSETGFKKHPCDGTIIQPQAAITGSIVGVATRAVTEDYYCWLQTKGPGVVLTNGNFLTGVACVRSVTTDGAADVYDNAGAGEVQFIGTCITAAASTDYSLVDLDIR